MREARHGRAGALATGLAVLVAGCATVPPPPAPAIATLRPADARPLLARWEAERRAFTGLRGAVDLTVRRQERIDRTAAVLLLSPTRLRLEVMTPVGLPVAVATAGLERVTVYRALERRAWTGRPTPEAMVRWLGTPLAPDVLIGLLGGLVPLPPDPEQVRVQDGPEGTHLEYERDAVRHRVWATPEGHPARLVLDGPRPATVTFEWGTNGRIQSLQVTVPGRDTELALRYLSAELTEPPPEAFELVLPPDVEIQRVD